MNPILSDEFYIPFDQIRAEHIEPGVREALALAEKRLADLCQAQEKYSYDSTLGKLEELTTDLGKIIGRAYHLSSVKNVPEIRKAFNAVLPEFSAFYAKLPLNNALWQTVKRFAETGEAKSLTGVYKRHLEKTLNEFERRGANLPPEDKARVEQLNVELSQLQTKFSENVLDSTNAFELLLTEDDLDGLPDSAIKQARADAEAKGKEGYRFTLQAPSFLPFIKHSKRRDLRKHMYQAYMSRATQGELDNTPLIETILKLRQELAKLLGYEHFADYRLEESMVKRGAVAQAFEEDIYERTLPYWRKESERLASFAIDNLGIDTLEPWDMSYVSEQLRRAHFAFDEEQLRPYFSLQNVEKGLFTIAKRLFGIHISQQDNPHVWHESVAFYDIHDDKGTHLGSFYTDWFPREEKRSGAWMNHFETGGPLAHDGFAPHLGLICGNFTPPQNGKPALLTHREVETIFHEFGHLIHHCLSRVEIPSRAGTNVSWDWVELPSQILENWTWERDALDIFARHSETGEPIPDDLFEKMTKARTFMEAHAQMRQLSFGTVDLALHIDYEPEHDGEVIAYAHKVMERFSLRPEFAHNNFINAFSHVFSGAYAAGYYSYKWSEVLEADAFSRFKKEGIFNREVGQAFVDAVLSRGDSEDPDVLYKEFMGREPDLNALFKRNLGEPVGSV